MLPCLWLVLTRLILFFFSNFFHFFIQSFHLGGCQLTCMAYIRSASLSNLDLTWSSLIPQTILSCMRVTGLAKLSLLFYFLSPSRSRLSFLTGLVHGSHVLYMADFSWVYSIPGTFASVELFCSSRGQPRLRCYSLIASSPMIYRKVAHCTSSDFTITPLAMANNSNVVATFSNFPRDFPAGTRWFEVCHLWVVRSTFLLTPCNVLCSSVNTKKQE